MADSRLACRLHLSVLLPCLLLIATVDGVSAAPITSCAGTLCPVSASYEVSGNRATMQHFGNLFAVTGSRSFSIRLRLVSEGNERPGLAAIVLSIDADGSNGASFRGSVSAGQYMRSGCSFGGASCGLAGTFDFTLGREFELAITGSASAGCAQGSFCSDVGYMQLARISLFELDGTPVALREIVIPEPRFLAIPGMAILALFRRYRRS